MQLTLPPDLELQVEKWLASGAYTTPEEVFRRALQALDHEESWTDAERMSASEKIERGYTQAATGLVVGPEESQQRLAKMRELHLAKKAAV